MPVCTKCNSEKSATEFHRNGDRRRPACKTCNNASTKKWRDENPEAYKASKKRSEVKHADRVAERHRRWRAKNPERARELSVKAMDKWRTLNPDKARVASRVQRAKRRAQETQRTLPGHDAFIAAIYKTASGLGLTVDHVVPLNGENVSGLHVPWNMQMLSDNQNKRKSNTFAVAA